MDFPITGTTILGPEWTKNAHTVKPVAPVTDMAKTGEYPQSPGRHGQPGAQPQPAPAAAPSKTGEGETTLLYNERGQILEVPDGPNPLIGIA